MTEPHRRWWGGKWFEMTSSKPHDGQVTITLEVTLGGRHFAEEVKLMRIVREEDESLERRLIVAQALALDVWEVMDKWARSYLLAHPETSSARLATETKKAYYRGDYRNSSEESAVFLPPEDRRP